MWRWARWVWIGRAALSGIDFLTGCTGTSIDGEPTERWSEWFEELARWRQDVEAEIGQLGDQSLSRRWGQGWVWRRNSQTAVDSFRDTPCTLRDRQTDRQTDRRQWSVRSASVNLPDYGHSASSSLMPRWVPLGRQFLLLPYLSPEK